MEPGKKEKGFVAWARGKRLLPDTRRYRGAALAAEYLRVVNRWAHALMLLVAEGALSVMVVVVTLTVILRYVFHTGIGWAEEVPRLLVTLFAFLACAIGVRDHMHVSVNLIYNLFPERSKARKAMEIFADICVLACGLFLLIYGAEYIGKLMKRPGILPMTGWPTFIQYIPAPMAGFVMAFDSILFLTGVLKPDDLLYSEKEIDYSRQVAHVQKEGK